MEEELEIREKREKRRGHDGFPNVVLEVGTVLHIVLLDECQLKHSNILQIEDFID